MWYIKHAPLKATEVFLVEADSLEDAQTKDGEYLGVWYDNSDDLPKYFPFETRNDAMFSVEAETD